MTEAFPARYTVNRIRNHPTAPVYEFRAPDDTRALMDLEIEVVPEDGNVWAGRFWDGGSTLTGTYPTPEPDTLCVVAKGAGYWVPVRDPSAFQTMACTPIRHVLPAPRLLTVADFTRLAAYGAAGPAWVTPDAARDGINNLDVADTTITGVAFDPVVGQDVTFEVDLRTGAVTGGVPRSGNQQG